jgi:hypothetical protein
MLCHTARVPLIVAVTHGLAAMRCGDMGWLKQPAAAELWCLLFHAFRHLFSFPCRGDMDGLKQYAAPWGYRAAERLSPGGRGWSLRVRACLLLLFSMLSLQRF